MDTKLAVQAIEDTIKQIETDIHTADKHKKNMDDNLRHRQFKAKKKAAEVERDGLNINEARIARADYEREYAKSKRTEQELTSQHATLMGEISSLKVQAKELKDTLATEYKNIKPDYMGKLIEVKVCTVQFLAPREVRSIADTLSPFFLARQTSDLANVDLEKYGKALDRCVGPLTSRRRPKLTAKLLSRWSQCDHALPQRQDGRDQRQPQAPLEPNVPRDRHRLDPHQVGLGRAKVVDRRPKELQLQSQSIASSARRLGAHIGLTSNFPAAGCDDEGSGGDGHARSMQCRAEGARVHHHPTRPL